LDTSFDGDGKLTTDFGWYDSGKSVTVQTDGKILVAGHTYINNNSTDFAIARYNIDGSLDTSFDSDGKVTTNLGSNDEGNSITLQADGKILVAGSSNYNFALARYNTDGSLDTSFDGDGKLTTDFGASDFGESITVQTDGKILVAGHTSSTSDYYFAIARYNTDGSLDTGFGNLLNAVAPLRYIGIAIVLDTDVQIYDAELSTGNNYSGTTLTLSRHAEANSSDQFSAKASGTLSALTQDSFFSVGGVSIGRVLNNSNGLLQLGFNSNATQTLVNQAMQQIAYANSATIPPVQVQIDWTFSDGNTGNQGTGGALSVTGNTQVVITARNVAPVVANALADVSIAPNQAFSHALSANAFTDANEGTVLNFSISMNDGTVLPTWLSFDSMARTLSGNPGNLGVFDLTEFDIKVTATDQLNAAVSDVFRL
jgi:uncharacterized delta-60 repeat protein